MGTVANILDEIKKQSEMALQQIGQMSYGVPSHDLWELIGSLKSTIDTTMFLVDDARNELNTENVE